MMLKAIVDLKLGLLNGQNEISPVWTGLSRSTTIQEPAMRFFRVRQITQNPWHFGSILVLVGRGLS